MNTGEALGVVACWLVREVGVAAPMVGLGTMALGSIAGQRDQIARAGVGVHLMAARKIF